VFCGEPYALPGRTHLGTYVVIGRRGFGARVSIANT
jgi:hypothetical protein